MSTQPALDPRVPLVVLENVTVTYPGTVALDQLNLTLYPGEIHAIMGQNGAGKSTIVKLLSGEIQPDQGSITIAGEEVTFRSPVDSVSAGIAGVYQDIHLSPALTVAENIMLGHEIKNRVGINWKATRAAARDQLNTLGVGHIDISSRLGYLPAPTQQLIALARALVVNPRILLLDEPTSSLEVEDVKLVFAAIRKLQARNVAIVFISHFLEQVYTISERMTVLRDGRNVGDYLTRQIDRAELISHMLGQDFDELQALGSERRAHHHEPDGDLLYSAEQLGRNGEVEPLDFGLHGGEIVGLAGLRGSGRSELALLLSGSWKADTGTISISGRTIKLNGPGSGLSHQIAMSSEDRTRDGIIGDFTVADNIMLGLQAMRGWNRPISRKERQETVRWYIDLLDLAPATGETPARFLSGGSQQKVLLARWLATRPKVMILDEPTKGIDIAAKLQIQRRITHLADQGMSVVFISSELEEVVRICDRIVVLKDRKKIGELSNGPGITVDTIVEMIAASDEDGF